jgi:hypothetical protein
LGDTYLRKISRRNGKTGSERRRTATAAKLGIHAELGRDDVSRTTSATIPGEEGRRTTKDQRIRRRASGILRGREQPSGLHGQRKLKNKPGEPYNTSCVNEAM